MSITFKTLTTGAMAAAIVAMGMVSVPASAGTVSNDNIHINKSRLKGKCKRSGGTFTESGNGRYGCSVDRNDGGFTTVNCNKKSNCVGFTNDKARVSGRPSRLSNNSRGQIVKWRN